MSTFIERHADWLRECERHNAFAYISKRVLDAHHARGHELLSEAVSRLIMASDELEKVAKNWIAEPFPSITCGEADALYMAMSHVGLPDELGDEFMTHHAYTDEADDGHITVSDAWGNIVGWEHRLIEDDDRSEMFEAVGLVFYDPVTDSLTTEE